MIDLRKAIKAEMKKEGIKSGYALSRLLKGKISQPAIDDFLKRGAQMKSGNIELILNFLDGELKFKR